MCVLSFIFTHHNGCCSTHTDYLALFGRIHSTLDFGSNDTYLPVFVVKVLYSQIYLTVVKESVCHPNISGLMESLSPS